MVGLIFDGNTHSHGGVLWFGVHSDAILEALRHVYRADALDELTRQR